MILWTITILSIFGLILAGFYAWRVVQAPTCSVKDSKTQISKLKKIHSAIAEGANAFLVQEYKFMLLFIVVFGSVVFFAVDAFLDPKTADINEGLYTLFSFVFGCLISILSGYIGMKIATSIGNLRTAVAAQSSLGKGFKLALNSGAVMGFALVSSFFTYSRCPFLFEVIAGFGLGAFCFLGADK